jgi:hypothetical protein
LACLLVSGAYPDHCLAQRALAHPIAHPAAAKPATATHPAPVAPPK